MYAIHIEDDHTLSWRKGAKIAEPGEFEVRINVAWAGMNRADSLQRQGNYPPPPGASETPGLEVSGTIAAIGSGVTRAKIGDRVCALLTGGGYAEQVITHELQVLPLPEAFTLKDAAALPEVFATAWLNLFMEAGLQQGERVVLHAGASSVGTTAIQLCKAFGNPVFVTAGSDDKIERCRALGADDGFNRHNGSFVDAVNAWGGADVILDPVGGDYLPQNQKVLKTDGRLVMIGVMGGMEETLNLGTMLMKRQRIIGSALRSRSPEQKGNIMRELYEQVWPLLGSGKIAPVIDGSWPVEQANEAMDYMEGNSGMGKLLLEIADT
ncbi:NAD(P)H-quinone oxidoreductase [Larsenimonas rhizosphaerae]|uniref:NAD(P)H-quinone oxidoreductase n=1 Tax=Larsenimonas rhizosphaerae TaxID=2944682 RepID=UPI0020348A96|nr:NAD(P)H-quinone oxidoreductase [Larsenimonas rhizosphaerae]MCM2131599.1 NAD(P)H-quinone oxidoreductase [Larsenimonas rhizosphaerae]